MSQRILLGMFCFLSVACCALFGLVWEQATRAERQAALANERLAELFTQARATDQEMLKQLQAMARAVQPGQSADWIRVSLKLTQETLDGPPAVDVEAQLARGGTRFRGGTGGWIGARRIDNFRQAEAIQRVSDENGVVDFGVVHPGDWQLYLTRWGKGQIAWRASETLNVLPGMKIVKSIICPNSPPDAARVELRVSWPADLAREGYLVEAWLEHAEVVYQPPLRWSFGPDLAAGRIRDFLCMTRGPETKQSDLGQGQGLYFWHFAHDAKGGPEVTGNETIDRGHLFADLPADGLLVELATPFDVGKYKLVRIVVLRRATPPSHKLARQRFDVIGHSSVKRELHPPIWVFTQPPTDRDFASRSGLGASQAQDGTPYSTKLVAVPDSFWQGTETRFEAQPGKVNEWTIRLPDELVSSLRQQLKKAESGGGKPKAE
jgi:hypothetical protein